VACLDRPEELIIDNTTTPCVQDIIERIKNGNFGNDVFVKLIRDIFDKNIEVNLTIVEEELGYDTDGDYANQNFQSSALYDNTFTFNSEIRLNSRFTGTASKDWILATTIHEMIHAYIQYQEARRIGGFITQAQFNSEFPLWATSGDHEVMASQYVGVITDILMAHNPTLDRKNEAEKLALGGLRKTNYFQALSLSDKTDVRSQTEIGRGTLTFPASNQLNCP